MSKISSFLLLISFGLGNLFKFSLFSPDVKFTLLDITLFVLSIISFPKILASKYSLKKPVLLFGGVALVTLLISGSRYGITAQFVGFMYIVRWLIYTLSFTFLPASRRLLLALGLITVFTGILQYTFFPDVRHLETVEWDPHYYRLVGTFLDPGFTGLIIVFTIIYLTIRPVANVVLNTFLWFATYLALSFTYSRSSYLAFLISMGFISWRRRTPLLLGLIILLFTLTVYVLPRPEGEGVKLERTSTIEARIINWKNSLSLIKDHPLIGVGFNTYRYAQKEYGFLTGSNWLSSHAGAGADSSLLFTAATTGFVGLVVYLYYLKKLTTYNLQLTTTVIALLVHSIFLNSLYYPPVMLWISLLLATEYKLRPTLS